MGFEVRVEGLDFGVGGTCMIATFAGLVEVAVIVWGRVIQQTAPGSGFRD